MSCPRLISAALLTALLAFSGCREPEIKTYTAPKDPAPVAMSGMDMSAASLPPSATAAPAIRWKLPAGWTDQGANNIRLGNILVTGPEGQRAEMTVTRFEGDVGGDLANINRWRNQLQLAPIDAPALAAAISHRDYPAGHMDVVDLVSDAPLSGAPEKTRTLVAWLPQSDATWFFKLTGSDSLVASQRDAFDAFLKSVEFSAAAPSSALPAGHPPLASEPVSATPAQTPATPPATPSAGQPDPSKSMSGASLPASALASSNALIWTAPASWTEKPLGPVRKGSFTVGDADLAITAFPGEVGGLLANLNRWRGELQMPPLSQADLPTATTTVPAADPALRFILVDFAGTPGSTPTRTLGAILPVGGDTYFFKLKGPDATVAQAKNDFLAFLATVKTR